MNRLSGLFILAWLMLGQWRAAAQAPPGPNRPNLVFILCDDLGYGDARCFNPDSKIPTPHLAAAGHHPSDHLRGAKADIYDGGHRVPFVARWPGRVAAGSTNAALFSLVDFMATCADLLDVTLPPNAGEDSVSFLPSLLGHSGASGRNTLVHHSINGSFAIRQGPWKLELCPDSGGWSQPKPGSPAARDLPPMQLYDLSVDLGETNNLQARHPEMVASLTSLLEQQIAAGRSTPGPPQTNSVKIRLRKNADDGAKRSRRANGMAFLASTYDRNLFDNVRVGPAPTEGAAKP